MAKIQSRDRCADCKTCRVWSPDRNKVTCDASWAPMHNRQGFHPDQPVPAKCVGQAERRY